MIAIIYPRVSTEEQAREGYSLASQRDACHARAVALGYDQADICEMSDDGISGDLLERPGLTRVRELIRQGGVGHFVCLDPDRLSRKLTHQLLLTEEFEKAGVALEFINFEWKNTAEGRLFYSLRGAIAEYEKEKIRERTMRGKRQKALQGKLTHNPRTFGFTYDPETSTFGINPTDSRLVQRIYSWCANEGASCREITKRLNDLGLPGPRSERWIPSTVRGILRNPAYAGEQTIQRYDSTGRKGNRFRKPEDRVSLRVHPEEHWVRIPVPQIVDRETWERAQEVQNEAKRHFPGVAKHEYLLSGLLVCGECGTTMHGNWTTGRGGKPFRYYTCTAHSPGLAGKPKCPAPSIQAPLLEGEIWRLVCEWVTNPEMLLAALKQTHQQKPPDTMGAQRELLEEQLEQVTQERRRLLNLYQKNLAPPEEIEPRLHELAGRERKVKEALAGLAPRHKTRTLPGLSDLEGLLSEFAADLKTMDFATRQRVVHLLIPRIVVFPNREIEVTADLPAHLSAF